jgi:hypothetical protein
MLGQSTTAALLARTNVMHSKFSRFSTPSTVHIEELLDEALRQTFPASDPIAIAIEHDVWIAKPGTAAEPNKTCTETPPR